MKLMRILFTAMVLVLTAQYIVADEKQQIIVEMQIFRVSGSLSGETRLEEEVWPKDEKPDHETLKTITAFTKGNFQIGAHSLECTRDEWKLNGETITEETPAELDQLRIISAPRVTVLSSESVNFDITASQVVEYFERREDGAYERREMSPQMGFELEITPDVESEETVRLRNLMLTLSSIEKREELEGVKLNVGKPIVTERESIVQMVVQNKKNYGLLFQSEDGRGVLIIRLKVEILKEEEK